MATQLKREAEIARLPARGDQRMGVNTTTSKTNANPMLTVSATMHIQMPMTIAMATVAAMATLGTMMLLWRRRWA